MLKYILVLILVVALIEGRPTKGGRDRGDAGKSSTSGRGRGSGGVSVSGSKDSSGSSDGSSDGSSEEPLMASDFHDGLQSVKDTAVEMSGAIHNVKELAEAALADPEGKGWEEFGEAMESTFTEVGHRFEEELHRVSKLAEALWFENNDLVRDDKCGFVAEVDKHKEEIDHVELAWALAMIQDLACMSGEFAQAENIPFDMLTGSLHEDDAVELVQSVIWEMHKIRRAGEVFGQSMNSIAQFLDTGSSGSNESGDEMTASYEETTEAAKETTEAAEETTEAARETTEAAKETTEAARDTTEAAEETTQAPVVTTSEVPVRETTQGARETTNNPAPRTSPRSADKRALDRLMRFLRKYSK